jgi:hypothetical protein
MTTQPEQPNKQYHQALTANRKLLEQVKELQTQLHPMSKHTEYTPCPGQDANGTSKHFVTIKRGNANTLFLSFNGQLLRFDTATDCLTFCCMLNSGFIMQSFAPEQIGRASCRERV